MNTVCKTLAGLLTAATLSSPASAAYIIFDDSDLNSITITAGDFEFGFSIDGNLLTSGLGNSGTITLNDDAYSISGSWIDGGLSNGGASDLLFGLTGDPFAVFSGSTISAITDGFIATLEGSFAGFNGIPYFFSGADLIAQNGQTVSGDLPFLTISFASEAPEPTSMALFGAAMAGLGLARRRKTAA